MIRRKGLVPRCKSFDLKSDAERWARELEAEIDRGGFLDTRLAETTTLRDVFRRYLEEVTPRKRSAHVERVRLKALMRHPIAYRSLALLSNADLASFRDERLKTVKPGTVIKDLNLISHAVDTAAKDWSIPIRANPCKLVRRPPVPKGRIRRLEGDEEARLLLAADRGRSPYMRPLIVLAIETGMRRGELLSLRWEHIDFTRRVAHLPMTKNGESRDVPLSTRAIETLRGLLSNHSDTVFTTTPIAVRLAWEHLVARAGIQNLHFHDLRHEAVSRLFEKGLNVIEVGAISGHKELRMLQRYTHLRAEELVARLG